MNTETVSAVRTEAPVATSTHGRTGAAGALLCGVQGEDGAARQASGLVEFRQKSKRLHRTLDLRFA